MDVPPIHPKGRYLSKPEATFPRIGRSLLLGAVTLLPPLIGFFTFFGHEFLTRFEEMKGGRIDSRYVIFVLEHWFQWFHGKGSLLSPPYFYPAQDTLGYASASLALVPFYTLARICQADPYSATQAAYMLCVALNYFVCLWFFHREIQLGLPASSLGAAFFAFNSAELNHLGHFNVMPLRTMN